MQNLAKKQVFYVSTSIWGGQHPNAGQNMQKLRTLEVQEQQLVQLQ